MRVQVLSLGRINGILAEKQTTNKKLTNEYIAEQMDISVTALSNKLNNKVPFKESAYEKANSLVGELAILAMLLGVDVSEFYKWIEI
jgi:hypothetical protein